MLHIAEFNSTMLPPLPSNAWDFAKAAHLLNRAGFGGAPEEIETLRQAGFDAAIERVLHGPDDSAAFPIPDLAPLEDVASMRGMLEKLTPEERQKKLKERGGNRQGQIFNLVGWWLDRMRRSANGLREKMTFFWHGHFTTSALKVREPFLLWQQNETLRQNALGNFGVMTKAITRDPAMMMYLDTQQNRKSHPNENFARELMELFTLGIGNYTEDDIQQAARAFTCYKINSRYLGGDMSFREVDSERDDGEKKFFGRSGNFSGDDVIGMILEKPVCAKFIAGKIWKFFASEEPSPALIEQLAGTFRDNHYEIRPLMSEIFRSAEFYSGATIRSQIKSPVQWLVQTAKVLEIDIPRGRQATNLLRELGQMPFLPPNVKGWDGGKAWINTATLLMRYNLAGTLSGGGAMGMGPERMMRNANAGDAPQRDGEKTAGIDFSRIAPPELRAEPKALVEKLALRLYQAQLTPKESAVFLKFLDEAQGDTSDQTIRSLVNLMMSTPEYQLI